MEILGFCSSTGVKIDENCGRRGEPRITMERSRKYRPVVPENNLVDINYFAGKFMEWEDFLQFNIVPENFAEQWEMSWDIGLVHAELQEEDDWRLAGEETQAEQMMAPASNENDVIQLEASRGNQHGDEERKVETKPNWLLTNPFMTMAEMDDK